LVQAGDEALVSVRAIADRIGITAPAIYLHFDDKDDLFHEVCQRRFRQLNRLFDDVTAKTNDPIEQLTELGRAYFRFGTENPEHYKVLMMTKMEHKHSDDDFGVDPPENQGDAAFNRLVAAVQRCIESGALRPGDPVVIAVTLWSGLHGLVSLMITAPNFPWPDREQLIEFILGAQMTGLQA
jgi:AcrR family transcriptional regulator